MATSSVLVLTVGENEPPALGKRTRKVNDQEKRANQAFLTSKVTTVAFKFLNQFGYATWLAGSQFLIKDWTLAMAGRAPNPNHQAIRWFFNWPHWNSTLPYRKCVSIEIFYCMNFRLSLNVFSHPDSLETDYVGLHRVTNAFHIILKSYFNSPGIWDIKLIHLLFIPLLSLTCINKQTNTPSITFSFLDHMPLWCLLPQWAGRPDLRLLPNTFFLPHEGRLFNNKKKEETAVYLTLYRTETVLGMYRTMWWL